MTAFTPDTQPRDEVPLSELINAAHLKALCGLSEAIWQADSLDAISVRTLDTLQSTLGATRAFLWLKDNDSHWRLAAQRRLAVPSYEQPEERTFRSADAGLSDPLSVNLASEQPVSDPDTVAAEEEDICAWRAFPLLFQDQHLGALVLCYGQPHQFSDEECRFVDAIASHAAVAAARLKTRAALQGAYEQLERRLTECTAQLAQAFATRRCLEVELNQSEEKWHGLVQNSLDGITLVDEQGIVIEWNRGEEMITGLRREDVPGRAIWDVWWQSAPDEMKESMSWEELRHFVLEFLSTGQAVQFRDLQELPVLHATGARKIIQMRAFPIQTGQGFMMGSISRDITAQKQAEEQLRRYSEELEQMVAERTSQIQLLERQRSQMEKLAATGRMAAGIAHEINNPLAGIKNAFLLLKDGIAADYPYYEYVPRVDQEIDRVARIVRQMYELYRPEQQEPRKFCLDTTIREVVSLLKVAWHERSVSVQIDCPPEGIVIVQREDLLRQALYNVLQNAAEASPVGGMVGVRAAVNGATLEIAVIDQGAGIPETIRERIFEPFFTTKNNQTGCARGLGLSVSKSLIEAMGGELDFITTLEEGTTFYIVVPMDREELC